MRTSICILLYVVCYHNNPSFATQKNITCIIFHHGFKTSMCTTLMSPAILYCLNYLSTHVTPWFCFKLCYHGDYSFILQILLNHVYYVISVCYVLTNFQGSILTVLFNPESRILLYLCENLTFI